MNKDKTNLDRLGELKNKFDEFLVLAEEHIHSKPWLVVILMHEYYRNLYPIDPYIPFKDGLSHTERISLILDKNIEILKNTEYLGSYFSQTTDLAKLADEKLANYKSKTKGKTQKVYDSLWKKFDIDNYLKEAKEIILERFLNSEFDFSTLKNKVLLDLGSGSGRYTIALALLSEAKKVYGVDLGEESIKRGKEIAKKAGVSNIEFKVADVLKLPFEDNFFDFIFCNGVLHHTDDMEKGIKELFRVLKPKARSYLYLYADGGLFWYARKKAPLLMKKIPQEYSMAILDLIGMPKNRFLFVDNWYVPKERHTSREFLEDYLKKAGFSEIKKITSGRSTDLDNYAVANIPEAKIIWGDGEHRYLLRK